MDKRPDKQNILYMAETGGETDENDGDNSSGIKRSKLD